MLRYLRPRPSPFLDALRDLAGAVHANTRRLIALKEITVANFEALNVAVAGLGTAIEDAVVRIDEDFQALLDRLNSGADQTAIDAATAQVQASIDRLKSIDPDPSNPAPAPEVL